MLEASGFDFRNRHPQEFLISLMKTYDFPKSSPVVKLAYQISLDMYRTWAPLKQPTATLAFACLELATRLLPDEEHEAIWKGTDYEMWGVRRVMVMETQLDLLELYTHHRGQSVIGGEFPVERFLEVRIPLNQEAEERKIPRYTGWVEEKGETNGVTVNGANGKKSVNVSPREMLASPRRGSSNTNASTSATSGAAGSGNATSAGGSGGQVAGVRQRVGERGREGTVRFILNPDRERDEKAIIELFSKD